MSTPFNPLDKGNLGISVREALLKQHVQPLSDLVIKSGNRFTNKFLGAGIYAIYYTGEFPAYRPIAEQNRDGKFASPIYVGKAVPEGARKGGLIDSEKTDALFKRLTIHARMIDEVSNLRLDDFHFRCLIVDDVWIPLGETYLIEKFQPLWNKKLDGFGNKTPGGNRRMQYASLWDAVHPGRSFVARLQLPAHRKTQDQILEEIAQYLTLPQEEKARLPVVDDGGLGDN